jgi:hypothetical protein
MLVGIVAIAGLVASAWLFLADNPGSDLLPWFFLFGVFLVPLAAGALIGRWWALALAPTPVACYALGLLDPGDTAAWFFLVATTLLFTFLIGAGVGVRKLASWMPR